MVAYPKSAEEMIGTVFAATDCGIPYRTFGRMSNILPPDGRFSGLLIRTDGIREIHVENELVSADCGVSLPSLASYLAENGFSSLEELAGIPGSVGGAVYMNAGAYGREISDVLVSVRAIDAAARAVRIISADDLRFSYRHSRLSEERLTVVSANFAYKKAAPSDIFEKMSHYAERRRNTQPVALPSLGSVFKRCDGRSAAALIDGCGLKGYRIGGAMISEKHAGFIVNVGGATALDYKAIVELAKSAVFNKYGVILTEEIEYLA